MNSYRIEYIYISLIMFSICFIAFLSFAISHHIVISLLLFTIALFILLVLITNFFKHASSGWYEIIYAVVCVFCINYFFKAIWIMVCPKTLLGRHYRYALDPDILGLALLYILGGLISFIFGYYLRFSTTVAYRVPGLSKWSKQHLFIKALIIYLCSFSFILFGAYKYGYFLRTSFQTINENPLQNYLFNSYHYLYFALSIMLYDNINTPRHSKKIVLLILLSLTFCLTAFSGSRTHLLMVGLVIAFIYKFFGSVQKIRNWMIIFIILFSLFYPTIIEFRNIYKNSYQGVVKATYLMNSMFESFSNTFSDYQNTNVQYPVNNLLVQLVMDRQSTLENLCTIISLTPDPNPYQLGKDFLYIIPNALIPRAIWKDKPEPQGHIIFNLDYLNCKDQYGFSSPSLIGDLYMNFGVVGILVGMFIAGMMLRFFYDYCINRTKFSIEGVTFYIILFLPIFLWVTESYVYKLVEPIKIIVYLVPVHYFMRLRI